MNLNKQAQSIKQKYCQESNHFPSRLDISLHVGCIAPCWTRPLPLPAFAPAAGTYLQTHGLTEAFFQTGNKAPAHHGTHRRGAQSSSRSWSCVALIASCKPGERIRKKQWTFNFRLEQLHGTFRGRYMPRLIRSRASFHWDGLKV